MFLVDPGVPGEKKCPWRTLVSLIDPKSLEDTSVPGGKWTWWTNVSLMD